MPESFADAILRISTALHSLVNLIDKLVIRAEKQNELHSSILGNMFTHSILQVKKIGYEGTHSQTGALHVILYFIVILQSLSLLRRPVICVCVMIYLNILKVRLFTNVDA